MSKTLSRMLDKSEKEIAASVSKLEALCGFPSEDVRLMAEEKRKLRTKIEQLGLDSDDTTDEELYHSLRARFERDSQMLDKALGVDDGTKLDDRLNKAIQLVNHAAATDEVWVVKNSFAKSALIKNPPKHIAKLLHYRSVASMIKRQDTAEIYLAGSVIESATWQKNISKHLAKLNASQYELRPIKIVNLRPNRRAGLDGPSSHTVVNRQIGAVAAWPSKELSSASVLCLTLLLLEGMRSLNPEGYTEALDELSPALRWWVDTGHLISDGEQPVSLNLKDVALNHLKGHNLTHAVRHHGARSLWDELANRYQKISVALSDKVPDIQVSFDQDEQVKLPTSTELAEEYATSE
ncbi:MAG: hypothetical protein WDZ34_00095 [Candidatus Saccharimonadales bacterium]